MGDQLKHGETMLDIMVIISCKMVDIIGEVMVIISCQIWTLRSRQPFFWLVVTATKKETYGYRDALYT